MAKTVVGLFNTIYDAQEAIQDLHDAGFHREDISFLARDAEREGARPAADTGTGAEEGAALGASGGAVLGGLSGLLVGIGALTIPGIGPVVGGGVLLATLAGAGIGAAAGGLVGALVGAGVPEEEAHVYAEGVRRGGALVTVQADTDDAAYRAADILNRNNAVDIDQRGREYREAGWSGFDGDTRPYDLSYSTAGEGDYARSSKVGTAIGGVAGAATGAALGSVGGPVGTIIGGVAGAAVGGGIGAVGDTAGVAADENASQPANYDTAPPAIVGGTASPSYATGTEATDEGVARPADHQETAAQREPGLEDAANPDIDRDQDAAGRDTRDNY